MENFLQIINRKKNDTPVSKKIEKKVPLVVEKKEENDNTKPEIKTKKKSNRGSSADFSTYFKEIISKEDKKIIDIEKGVDIEEDKEIILDNLEKKVINLTESIDVVKITKLITKTIKSISDNCVKEWEIVVERDDEKLIKLINMKEVSDYGEVSKKGKTIDN